MFKYSVSFVFDCCEELFHLFTDMKEENEEICKIQIIETIGQIRVSIYLLKDYFNANNDFNRVAFRCSKYNITVKIHENSSEK